MKILFTLIFFMIPLTALTQNTIESYLYWFNSDIENMISGFTGHEPGEPVYSFSASIGSDGLPDGLHVINFRFRDSEKKWSPVLSRFFYRMPVSEASGATIDRVSYWFNNDVASATEEAVSGSGSFLFNPSVSAEALPDGLHVINFRFRDSEKKWSPVLSRFFYRMPVTADSEARVATYSYWFNNDVSNAIEQTVPQSGSIVINEKFDAATLPDGLHVFNIRFKDTTGKWSSTLSRFFYRMPLQETNEENLVSAYQYWFNDNDAMSFRVDLEQPVNPLHLLADIEVPFLEPGGHALNIRFMDLGGKWSPVLTETFETEDCNPGYIEEPAGEVEVCQGSENLYTVQAALNVTEFHWSLTPAEAGTLVTDGPAVTVNWDAGFDGSAALSVYGSNPCGQTEAKSLAVEVIPEPFVIAMDDTSVCKGQPILLEVVGSEGVVEWNVEEVTVTPDEETTYTVTATNLCGVAHDQVVIGIDTPPSLTAMDDIIICKGEQIELVAQTDGVLAWCSGTNVVAPSETSAFTATATNSCGIVEDQVVVTVKPLPLLEVMADAEICEGEEVTLQAGSDVMVSWSSGTNVVSPATTTIYTASAEKDGCISEEQVTIAVHPVPGTPVLIQDGDRLISDLPAGNIWFFDGIEIAGAEGQEYSPEKSGEYFVKVLSEKGCLSEPSNTISFTVSSSLILGTRDIHVYPNPAGERIFINPGTNGGESFTVELLSLEGRVLITRKINNETYINIGGLAPTVYILRISHAGETRMIRIIKN